jgi:uncharacterized membrane protein SpoIIM required for sporulation
LLTNGIMLGSIAGWMTAQGRGRAMWGWIMPHGGLELLAIVLAGAAGLVLAGAIVVPVPAVSLAMRDPSAGAAVTAQNFRMPQFLIETWRIRPELFTPPSNLTRVK